MYECILNIKNDKKIRHQALIIKDFPTLPEYYYKTWDEMSKDKNERTHPNTKLSKK